MTYSQDNVFEGDFVRTKYEGDPLIQVFETTSDGFKAIDNHGMEHIHLPYSDIKVLLLESEGYDEFYSQ